MKPILINGNFLNRNLTGIERFAWEVLEKLDSLIDNSVQISILVSKNAKNIPSYQNIKVINSKYSLKSFPLWDFFLFPLECKKQKAIALNFSNTASLGKNCGIAFIHDIYAKDFPKDFTTFRDKLIAAYSKFNYWNICKNAKHIITVSNFSKKRIQNVYGISENRISIVPNGWEHFEKISEDNSILERFSILKKGEFYFTLGSLSKRKNLVWIAEYAKNHSKEIFAISGKTISGLVPEELKILQTLKNVVLVGYLSDEQVKCMMKNCRAFIFPSYYEGFGIPPLEALSVGAKIIISKSASLPEIYESSAHYIEYDKQDISLETLLETPVLDAKSILEKYTYKEAAKKLLQICIQ